MATQAPPATAGPAHVAVVSFLAARAAPSGGFWIALAGGVALARVARRAGARLGFGTSIAAMLETVAIIGPARFGIPLTQAATAPLLGRLEARGVARRCRCWPARPSGCSTTRPPPRSSSGSSPAASTPTPARTTHSPRRVGLEVGTADVLVLTALGLLVWAAFASVVQVIVYRRGLHEWERLAGRGGRLGREPVETNPPRPRPGGSGASTRALSPWPPRSPSRCC